MDVLTATEQLAERAQEAAAAKGRARELAGTAQSAKNRVDEGYAQLVEAHAQDDAAKVTAAKKAHEKAKRELEARVAEAQGAELRARRGEQAVAAFQRDNADALLADLEPHATAATEALAAALNAVEAHAAEWNQIAQQVNQLVAVSGRGTPRDNCPAGHGFEAVVQTVRQALASTEPVSPMPNWRHVRFLEQQQREAEQRASARGEAA